MRVSRKNIYLFLVGVFVADCVFSESHISDIHFFNVILTFIRYASLTTLLFVTICDRKLPLKRNQWYIFAFIFFALINCFLCGGGTSILFILVIILTFNRYNVHSEEMFPFMIKLMVTSSAVVFLLSFVGLIDDTVGMRTVGLEMGKFFAGDYTRHSYGFLTQNQFPLTLSILYILRISYKRETVRFTENLTWLIIGYLFFKIFGSRIAFISLTISVMAYLILKFIQKVKGGRNFLKNQRPKLWLSFVACFSISAFACFCYNDRSPIWRYVNNVFMDRFRMTNYAIQQYGISIFGKGLQVSRNIRGIENATIDNGYLSVLLQHEILICLIVMFIWCFMTFKAEKKANKYLLIVLVAFSVMNIIDSHLISYKMIPFYCLMMEEKTSIFELKPKKRLEENADFYNSTGI